MSKRGKILILVSPSGGGKSTMTKRLLRDFDKIKFSVSATTRPPRKGEEDGVHYHFLTKENFKQKVADGDFLEWEEFYNGTMYGTLRSVVENELNKGYFILLDIDVLGAKNVKELYGDEALALFIKPPSLQVLKERLIARGTESEETLNTRIERAEKELEYASDFDTVIVNDDLETAYNQIKETVSNFINS
ncbi:guanylate kinase [Rhodohalobacter halophilus]|uniref:guanylate kinase n=1 Tax=Rhodohalobacter halophilus TaxID=1812810 RepID=UPI00083FA2EE|nr:guanylate kinase [Rhodohalobacter halophilus]